MSHHNIQNPTHFNHILIICVALLVGLQVFISNKIATSGKQISQLEQKAAQLEDDNRKLLSENIESLSLQQLSSKAVELGFVPADRIIQLSGSNTSLALRDR